MKPSDSAATLEQVRRLARTLDTSIPLPGGLRIGWDAVLGLIPGVGDGAGAVLSSFIVIQAARLGASRAVLTRMVGNVALEALLGSVPFLGDLFDAAFKANVRNVRLLEQHLERPQETRRASALLVVALILVVLLALVGAGVLAVWVIRQIAGAF